MSSKGCVKHIPKITKLANTVCDECKKGKQTRVSFETKEYSTTRPLEPVYSNLRGLTRTRTLNSEKYFMLFIDDSLRITWVTFL